MKTSGRFFDRRRLSSGAKILVMLIAVGSSGALRAADVWVQFGAAFETQLNAAAAVAGVAAFTPSERVEVENTILTELERVYAGYNLDFSTTDPGGTREILNYAPSTPPANAGTLGVAPLDFGNRSAPGSTARIFTDRFGFHIESGDARVDQVHEIGMGLASSGAHEVLHTLGGRHGNAYSADGITSANYAATGGLQATQVLSSGFSGANESIKEAGRNISPWSKVILDVAGGHAVGGTPVVSNPVMSTLESGDAGDSFMMATVASLTLGETSGQLISMIEGDLDGGAFDLDYYTFSAAGPSLFTADLYSIQRFNAANEFNAMLTLFDTDGVTPLITVDDTFYGGNTFGAGTLRTEDPFFVNFELPAAGSYFVEVKASNAAVEAAGDNYILLMGLGLPVPEPSRWVLGMVAIIGCLLRRTSRFTLG